MKVLSDLNLSSNAITNVASITLQAAPSQAGHAATKGYVDSLAQGLSVKKSCRAASTANIADLANASVSMDGITLVEGDRVLLKDQSTQSENGIYAVGAVAAGMAAFTRADDADAAADVVHGMFTLIEEGTANGKTGWILIIAGSAAVTLGSTALTFQQFTGLSDITATGGLEKNGNTLSIAAIGALGAGVNNATLVDVNTRGQITATYSSVYRATLTGDGSAAEFTVSHNLNNQYALVQVYDMADDKLVEVDVKAHDANTVKVNFASAPANAATYKVVVVAA